jgi:sigma-B regulation protein RsbU (phosphoserine phosphatase)
VVLLVATVWGSGPAFVASAAGVVCFNFFFLPPLYTLTIAEPQNWVALAAFLVTAVTAGQLSELAKRRAAEAAAVRKETRLASAHKRSLLEASLDALVTIGSDGKIDDLNSAIETLTGRSRAALIGTDFSDCFTERELARAAYREVLREGFVRDRPLQLRHLDGHETSVLYNASLHRDEGGNVIGVVAAARSISTSAGRDVIAVAGGVVRNLNRFVAWTGAASVAVGVLALIGWALDLAILKSVLPGQVVIKPNAAITLVLCGGSLWLLRATDARPPRGGRRLAGRVLASVVAATGLLSLSEHVVGWDLGIDQWIFPDDDPWEAFGSLRPGLMAPITALDFCLLGLALLWLDWTVAYRSLRFRPAQPLAIAAGIGAIVGLLDFVLESHTSYTHIALQTAVVLLVLSVAVACARTDAGLGALFVSASDGGTLVRRLGLATILAPLLIGSLWWKAQAAGVVSEWGGITAMIVAMIVLLAGMTVWSGHSIDRSDIERRHAERSLHRSEEELRESQRLARVGSWWWEPATDTVTWSEGLYRIAGRDPKTPPPGFADHARFYTADSFARLTAAVEHAVQTGAPFELALEVVRADGAIRSVTSRGEVERGADGRVILVRGTVHDITEHKQVEEARQRSEANLNKAQEIAHVGSWHLDVACDRLIWSDEVFRIFEVPRGTPLTYESFLGAIHPADREAVERAWTAAMRGAPYDIEHRIVVPAGVKWVRERAEVAFDKDGHPLTGIGTVQDITERKRAQEELLRSAEELRELNAELEQRVRARTADLEAAREREGQIGFRIQQMLLLTQPPTDLAGLQVAALTIPSQRIDGDFYDFFKHEDQRLDVIVADVMGKGIPAALLAGAIKSNFLEALCHLMALGALPEPKEIVTLAHADIVRQLIDLESFVTVSYARFDLSRQRLDLVDCGHTGMMIVRARTGACEIVHGDNLPLGIREGEIFDQIAIAFEPGDLFVFYSDGITETRNSAGELYGVDRLMECVRSHRELAPAALVEAIRNSAVAFGESHQQSDDLTCVVVKVSEAQRPLAHSELELRSDLVELRRAREFVRAFCGEVPAGLLDQDDVAALELAVNEAASNIMKHAYHGRVDQRIQLEADLRPGRVSIRLHHLGDPFDPATAPPPALDGSRESGFGIHLISRSVDDVRYTRDERGRNCIALVKVLRKGQHP